VFENPTERDGVMSLQYFKRLIRYFIEKILSSYGLISIYEHISILRLNKSDEKVVQNVFHYGNNVDIKE